MPDRPAHRREVGRYRWRYTLGGRLPRTMADVWLTAQAAGGLLTARPKSQCCWHSYIDVPFGVPFECECPFWRQGGVRVNAGFSFTKETPFTQSALRFAPQSRAAGTSGHRNQASAAGSFAVSFKIGNHFLSRSKLCD